MVGLNPIAIAWFNTKLLGTSTLISCYFYIPIQHKMIAL